MDPVRWRRVEELFHHALALDPTVRGPFLDDACASSPDLRAEIDSLLAVQPESDRFLAAPALDLAARALHAPLRGPADDGPALGSRIGQFCLRRKIGEGGMGVVYEADDERLGRRVAIKLLRRDALDPRARERLVREARVAAGAVHPNICQVFDLGEVQGQPFLVMELVEGETLATRLARGPIAPLEALRLLAVILDALGALHAHGVVHRDLKPANVILGGQGPKLLDFGLARPVAAASDDTGQPLTAAGMFVGTPQYASPEQLVGGEVDERSDIYSAATMAFEMLTGRPVFAASTLPALVHAVLYGSVPVLTGSPAVAAVDRVLHRALAKDPAERQQTAQLFAAQVRSALALIDSGQVVEARSILRLAVLPFHVLAPDQAVDYLGASLADALTSSLMGLESVVVRSTLQSGRYAARPLNLDRLAADLGVDVVLTGTLLARGDRLRVSSELVAAPSGDVWWSSVDVIGAGAVLELHDAIARGVRQALPLTRRDRAAAPSVRATNERAFDLYLRGMQLKGEASAWRQAHALFVKSVELDPEFASAWAERGRLERILGKYDDPTARAEAQHSLSRAAALDPESGATQHYLAQLDIDLGRVEAALIRLLDRAQERRAEPHVFAALVHACRYAGLLDASVGAHEAAARLDPMVPTSVLHTYYMRGDFARALEQAHRSNDPLEARVLGAMGRTDEARAAARAEEARFAAVPLLSAFSVGLRAALEGRPDAVRTALAPFDDAKFTDGEGLFYVAEIHAAAGAHAPAFALLTRAVDGGFLCSEAFERDVYLRPLHNHEGWPALLARLRRAQSSVWRQFDQRRGRLLLA